VPRPQRLLPRQRPLRSDRRRRLLGLAARLVVALGRLVHLLLERYADVALGPALVVRLGMVRRRDLAMHYCHGSPPGQVTLVIRPKECAEGSSALR
jgi:hypothetical protein